MSDEGNFRKDACPNCGYKVDSASEIHNDEAAKPTRGDFSMCLNCGALLRFNAELNLELCEDTSDLSPDQFAEVRKAQAFIRQRGIFT